MNGHVLPAIDQPMFRNAHGILKGVLGALPRPLTFVRTTWAHSRPICWAPSSAQPGGLKAHANAASVQIKTTSLSSLSDDGVQALVEAQGRILR